MRGRELLAHPRLFGYGQRPIWAMGAMDLRPSWTPASDERWRGGGLTRGSEEHLLSGVKAVSSVFAEAPLPEWREERVSHGNRGL